LYEVLGVKTGTYVRDSARGVHVEVDFSICAGIPVMCVRDPGFIILHSGSWEPGTNKRSNGCPSLNKSAPIEIFHFEFTWFKFGVLPGPSESKAKSELNLPWTSDRICNAPSTWISN
jgi:hypothetical protein